MTDTRLEPGSLAPDFTLVDQDERAVTLSDLRDSEGHASQGHASEGHASEGHSGGVVLFFYPEAMTPGCTTEACDFRDSLAPLQAAGYTILGISRDAPEKLRRFRERDGLTYDLLSDPDHAVHDAYGAWGEKMNYGKVVEGVLRSTFVLDADGRIVQALYNVKATGHVGRVRELLGV